MIVAMLAARRHITQFMFMHAGRVALHQPSLPPFQIKWAVESGVPIVPVVHKAMRGVSPFTPASEAALDDSGFLLFKVRGVQLLLYLCEGLE